MDYFNFGQLGYGNNPFLNGSNPFAGSYTNNPFLNNSFGSSLFQAPSINFGAYGFCPNYTKYNFLNNPVAPTPTAGYNFGTYNSPSLNSFSSFNIGGYGSLGNYNFLNSSYTTPTTQSLNSYNFESQFTNPYTLTNLPNYQILNTLPQNEEEKTDKTEKNKGKIISNNQGYGPEFLAKVKRIANNLNCNYKDLLAVMNAESGIKTTAVNKSTNATGLIQFMPKTAQGLGTTVEELKKMTPVEQLDYVEKYLTQTKRQAGFSSDKQLSGGELYALVFRPAKAKTGIFATKGEAAYKLNSALDLNKDGKVTMSELGKRVENFYVSDKSFVA